MKTSAKVGIAAVLALAMGSSCQSVLDVDNGVLVDCVKDADCRTGTICSLATHTCMSPARCSGDNSCDAGQVCSPTTSACVAISCAEAGCQPAPDASLPARDAFAPADAGAEREASSFGPKIAKPDAAMPDASVTPLALSITSSLPSSSCTGKTYSIGLLATNGLPHYQWDLVRADAGFTLASMDDALAVLSFVPMAVGQESAVVRVRDSMGNAVEQPVSLRVYETPRIDGLSPPTLCSGEVYTQTLSAQGGDEGAYQWGSDADANSGVSIAGDVLTARISQQAAGTGATPMTVHVTASDTHCQSVPAEITLAVAGADAGTCPSIQPDELPAPCGTDAYRFSNFRFSGGVAPYHWSALSTLPSGLTFDSDNVVLAGTISDPTTFTLQVSDDSGRRFEKTYSLTPRQKCWLAYVSAETGPARLNLVDPVIAPTSGPLSLGRYTFPANQGDPSNVVDFQFSPDGTWLAYRLTDAGGASRLALLNVATRVERDLALPGAVGATYSWSPDSSLLVATLDGGTSVAAVDVTMPIAPPGNDAAEGGTVVATNVRVSTVPGTADSLSDVAWLPPSTLAFPGNEFGFEVPFYVQWSATSTSAAVALDQTFYGPPLFLRPGATGFYSISTSGIPLHLDFHRIGNPRINVYSAGSVADPGGRYAAKAVAGELQLFQTGVDVSPPPVWARGAGCNRLLAWAANRERLACVTNTADGGGPGIVRIYDLNAVSAGLDSQDVHNNYTYSEGASVAHRRLFSPSGAWLAFTTDNMVYVVDARDPVPWAMPFPLPATVQVAPSELAFSADERYLLWYHGTSVIVVRLDGSGQSYGLLAAPFRSAGPCQEDFLTDPHNWCGGLPDPPLVAWSSDSLFAAAITASGGLVSMDVRPGVGQFDVCVSSCTDKFGFQP